MGTLTNIKFRWLTETEEHWQWSSRDDEWSKSVHTSAPRLQFSTDWRKVPGTQPGYYAIEPIWHDIPTVNIITKPAGPMPE